MTRIIVIFIATFFISLQLHAASNNWVKTFGNTPAPSGEMHDYWIEDIFVLDSNNVYAVLWDELGDGRTSYAIRSKDGGFTWDTIFRNQESRNFGELSYLFALDTNNIYITDRGSNLWKSNNGFLTYDSLIIEGNGRVVMYDTLIGITAGGLMNLTKDGWDSYDNITSRYEEENGQYLYWGFFDAEFLNDSIIYTFPYYNSEGYVATKFNINTEELTHSNPLLKGESNIIIQEFRSFGDSIIFGAGGHRQNMGATVNNLIVKSIDGGNTWRNVHDYFCASFGFGKDFSNYYFASGIENIAFLNERIGIGTGKAGIIYTYDGGETWIYDPELDIELFEPQSSVEWHVEYVGKTPIIGTSKGDIFVMTEDNLAPGPADTLTLIGRVHHEGKGVPGVAVAIGSRICMTDSLGFYKFTQLTEAMHTVKALNKYYEGTNMEYYRKPFTFVPDSQNVFVRRNWPNRSDFLAVKNLDTLITTHFTNCSRPRDSDVYPKPLNYEWDEVDYAIGYEAYLYDINNPSFTRYIRTDSTSYDFENLPIGYYMTKVRAIYPDSTKTSGETLSPWSSECWGYLSLPQPELQNADCPLIELDYGDTLRWEMPIELDRDLLRYELTIYNDPAFRDWHIHRQYLDIKDDFVIFNEDMGLDPGTQYWMFIQAAGYGEEYTPSFHLKSPRVECSFTTVPWQGVDEKERESKAYRVRVDDSRIYVYSSKKINSLQLFDLNSREVANSNTTNLSSQHLSHGIYFLLINGEEMVKVWIE